MKKANLVITISLIFIGLVDVSIRWYTCKSAGLTYALNDPAKTFFHIFILPAAYYVFTKDLTFDKIFKNYSRNIRSRTFLALAIFSIFFSLIMISVEVENFCGENNNNFVMPHDFKSPQRDTLIKIREKIHTIHRLSLDTISKIDSLKISNYKKQYHTIVNLRTQNCSYIKEAPFFSYWSGFGTFIALLFCSIIFFTLLFGIITNSEHLISKASLITCILSPWVIFRVYSEFYINFLTPDFSNFYSSILMAFSLVIFSIITSIREVKRKTIITIISIVYPILGGIIAAVSKWNLSAMKGLLLFIFTAPSQYLLIVFTILIFIPLSLINVQENNDDNPPARIIINP